MVFTPLSSLGTLPLLLEAKLSGFVSMHGLWILSLLEKCIHSLQYKTKMGN